uniref:Uncharacterized protein n=1 Tax=Eutreptiella gymnastica TaxID=73025 RepID=A0A7S1NWV5_9EUGL|mmetsp:Transcript_96426/g.166194  ORF Transcript_96426/g.166194 Transcript_96426/m.166194 type:complete len:776 (+) Transcript_96426:119-2446(+)
MDMEAVADIGTPREYVQPEYRRAVAVKKLQCPLKYRARKIRKPKGRYFDPQHISNVRKEFGDSHLFYLVHVIITALEHLQADALLIFRKVKWFFSKVKKVQAFYRSYRSTKHQRLHHMTEVWVKKEKDIFRARRFKLKQLVEKWEWMTKRPPALTAADVWSDYAPCMIPRSLKWKCVQAYWEGHKKKYITDLRKWLMLQDEVKQQMKQEASNRRVLRRLQQSGVDVPAASSESRISDFMILNSRLPPCPVFRFNIEVRELHEMAVDSARELWVHAIRADSAEVFQNLSTMFEVAPKEYWEEALTEWKVTVAMEATFGYARVAEGNVSFNLDLEDELYSARSAQTTPRHSARGMKALSIRKKQSKVERDAEATPRSEGQASARTADFSDPQPMDAANSACSTARESQWTVSDTDASASADRGASKRRGRIVQVVEPSAERHETESEGFVPWCPDSARSEYTEYTEDGEYIDYNEEVSEYNEDGDYQAAPPSPPAPHFYTHRPARAAVAREVNTKHRSPRNMLPPNRIFEMMPHSADSEQYRRPAPRKDHVAPPPEPVVRHPRLYERHEKAWDKRLLDGVHIRVGRDPVASLQPKRDLGMKNQWISPTTARKYASALMTSGSRSQQRQEGASFNAPTFCQQQRFKTEKVWFPDEEDDVNLKPRKQKRSVVKPKARRAKTANLDDNVSDPSYAQHRKRSSVQVTKLLDSRDFPVPTSDKLQPTHCYKVPEVIKQHTLAAATNQLAGAAPVDHVAPTSTQFEARFAKLYQELLGMASEQ